MDKTENSSKGKLSTSLGRPYLSQPQAVWGVKHPPQMWRTKCVHRIRYPLEALVIMHEDA